MVAETPKRRNMAFSDKFMISLNTFLRIFLPYNDQKLDVTANCIEDKLAS